MRAFPLAFLLLATAASAASPTIGDDGVWEAPPGCRDCSWLRLLHVNDLHGHVFPRFYTGENLPPEYLGRPIGSLFSVASYVSRLRARRLRRDPGALRRRMRGEGDGILLLDAGDWTGGALYEATTRGLSTARVLTDPALDLDATVLGNHAWDYYRDGLLDFVAAVGSRFPVLGGNVRYRGRRPSWARNSAVLEVDGVKVGVIGILNEHAIEAALPEKTVGYSVTGILELLDREVRRLRRKVDVLVLLAHVGCEREPELQEKISHWLDGFSAPPIDLVVDGHSHRDLDMRLADRVPVVQADHFGTRLGEVLLELGPERRPTGRLHTRRVVLDADEFPPPLRMLARHADDIAARRRVEEEPVAACEPGLIIPALPRSDPRLVSPIGDLIAAAFLDAVREHYRERDVTIGVMNQGGVRMGLYGVGRRIQRAALHAVIPFGNTLAVMELPGAALRRFVERGVQHKGRFSVRGLDVEVRDLPPEFSGQPPRRELVRVELLLPDGSTAPIDPAARYKIATSQYLAGRGFDGETGVVRRDLDMTDYESVARYLKKLAREDGAVTWKGVERRQPRRIRFVD